MPLARPPIHQRALLAASPSSATCSASAPFLRSRQCEEALRRGVFGASGLRRPGEVLLGMLQQPFLELRLAAYR